MGSIIHAYGTRSGGRSDFGAGVLLIGKAIGANACIGSTTNSESFDEPQHLVAAGSVIGDRRL